MRALHPSIVAVVVAGLVAGCAAAAPGYIPPRGDGKDTTPLVLKPFQSGSVAESGVYVVSDAEKKLTCGKISGSMYVIMTRLKDGGNRPQASLTARTLQSVSGPLSASSPPPDIATEHAREKARLKAYNALLVQKKCAPLDIAAFS